jgi:NAD(P)-dependent dehydrogenase (short-subunit alcohol dehydrogenase family)
VSSHRYDAASAPATRMSKNGWDAVIDLHLTAIFTITKSAYPYLKARHDAVVNMSLSGVERGSMGLSHSISARAGVLGLTRSLALEWAKDGVRLNCIGPGTVVTEGLSGEAARPMLERLIAGTPVVRHTERCGARRTSIAIATMDGPRGRVRFRGIGGAERGMG